MGRLTQHSRAAVNQFVKQVGEYHGQDATQEFTIAPTEVQTLQDLMVLDGSSFLQQINVMPRSEMKGQKLFGAVTGLVAARTAITSNTERVPTDPSGLTENDYEMFSIEGDVAISYDLIDAWAKFPDFTGRWANWVRTALANDRVRVGFNGTSAAATTNKVNNPNGEDVLPGWFEQIRAYDSGSQYLAGTTVAGTPPVTTHHVVLGSETYPNLNYLVASAVSMIDPIYINNPGLAALISQDLASYADMAFYKASGNLPSEMQAMLNQPGRLLHNYGGIPSWTVPFMPAGSILVTLLKNPMGGGVSNLSIYHQDSSWRRTIRDWPQKNQYQDFNSRNECYAVEDFRACALIDGITKA